MQKQPKPFTMPSIVQFIHPGCEYLVTYPAGVNLLDISWAIERNQCKCNDHHRRLICATGDYVEKSGQLSTAKLAFWGEWEACTRARKMPPPPTGRDAHSVHFPKSPFYGGSDPNLLNTDPCVFGKSFKYCICQQTNSGALRRLAPRSLILFGTHVSKGGSKFLLDTVFVTDGTRIPYDCQDSSNLPVSGEYRELTLKRLHQGAGSFYRAETFPPTGNFAMYSFVPARLYSADNPLCGKRCELDIDDLNTILPDCREKQLNPELPQKFKHIETDSATVFAVWSKVLKQVRKQKFLPAVHFNWPK